jgi:hypothetical protein
MICAVFFMHLCCSSGLAPKRLNVGSLTHSLDSIALFEPGLPFPEAMVGTLAVRVSLA